VNNTQPHLPAAFLGCCLAAAGAVTTITSAVLHHYALRSIALFALAAIRSWGFRPAAVRLSIQRLASSGQIPRNTDRG
jgi:hypothetical protein